MAKVRFYFDNGANIKPKRCHEVDTVEDLGLEEGEWEQMTDDEKFEQVSDYWTNLGVPDMWWEEE